jgi:cobalamin biosynthetic protein CobC
MSAWTFHGGRLREAQVAYGQPIEAWLDLSTGINPHPWPHADVSIDWARLPDEIALGELEASAAQYFGVKPSNLCAVPGTEVGLRLLGGLLPARPAYISPGYRTYATMTKGVATPVEELMKLKGASIILANPNNPDGQVINYEEMHKLSRRLSRGHHWLIVDEAFVDVEPRLSVAGLVGEARNLVVLRSFGKFFGLAGVRLGFILGKSALIEKVRHRLGSWPVSAAALAIGSAAYRDARWIETMRRTLSGEAEALDMLLKSHGFAVSGECPLFRLIDTQDATALFEQLAHCAILTRPFRHNPRWLRIGLPGTAEAFDRLERALANG